ncbi:uncharacterized protein LOC112556099 [Pomacea canaliculata]|nr:uncharacterized protein LOC112556099 [Pomacea canaliculata]XP_025080555.1 uncharacterized protein LOC112556099 [Pomacea canaliculata]
MSRVIRRATGVLTSASTEDGDFVALRARREERQLDVISEELEDFEAPVTTAVVDRPVSARTRTAKDRLFEEAEKAKPEQFLELLNVFANENGLAKLRHPENNMNILHYVLHHRRRDLATMIAERVEPAVFSQECDVTVAAIKGKKTALHYVTELNDLQLAKLILNKVNAAQKKEILAQETPVEIEGQRPRTLPPCHLAAFLGFTDLVVLYLDNGAEVNAVNSKMDTTLLWAARWSHLDIVKVLLDRCADTSIENDKGSTALYWAVRYGHTECVKLLVSQGKADIGQTRKLGLVSPIVLASALGFLPIVQILIENGADPNTCIRGKERPLHHAAKEGYPEVVSYLLEKGAGIDHADEIGDTALLHAARHGFAKCVQVLLNRGANHKHKNHMGEDFMSLAVESHNKQILKIAMQFTKDSQAVRSPLLLAAAAGDCEKITELLKMGLDPGVIDDDKNTILHRAAMEDRYQVIKSFHDKVKIDSQNSAGNTALHEACERGFSKTIGALISSKATASIRNNLGETALHVAARCRSIQPETVKILMDYVIKSHAWESLNIKDNFGNNALHIAAKFARPEVMWEFRSVPFKTKDDDGNIALHEAVRPGEPEALTAMLDIFEAMKRDADINEQNKAKETVLHLAAKEGFADHMARLVILGADLSAQDISGNTVLHMVTILSANYPRKAKTCVTVFDAILAQAVMWWCQKHQREYPHGDEDTLRQFTRQAALRLLTETYNKEDLNVLALACKVGAADILRLVLGKSEVMCFHYTDEVLYTVTNMTPLTNNSVTGCCPGGTVVPRLSYLEWLLSLDNSEQACKVLDVQPFRDMEKAYSRVAALTYAIIMAIHIVYMSLFSYSSIDLLERRRTDPGSAAWPASRIILYAVVPLEPSFILLYQLYSFAQAICVGEAPLQYKLLLGFRKGFTAVLNTALPVIIGVIYSSSVVIWIILYSVDVSIMEYALALALCVGWLYTISFTRGFRIIHFFWRMIQNMIVKDIVKFFFIYIFVLLGFAFAIHSILQVSQVAASKYPSPLDTMFLVFRMMIGQADIFDDDVNSSVGSSYLTFLKLTYLVYIVLATILLLNLLIAMMNDSYSAILNRNSVDWRLESVKLGVDIEKAFPRLLTLFGRAKLRRGLVLSNNGPVLASKATSDPELSVKVDAPEAWYMTVKGAEQREDAETAATERELLHDLSSRVTAIEQKLTFDLQQVRQTLDDVRAHLKEGSLAMQNVRTS